MGCYATWGSRWLHRLLLIWWVSRWMWQSLELIYRLFLPAADCVICYIDRSSLVEAGNIEANRQEHKANGLLDGKENISLSHKYKQGYRLQLFLPPPSGPIVLAQWSASVHIDAPISLSDVTGLSNLRQVEGVTPLLACHMQVNELTTKNRPIVCIRNILGGCWSK